MLNVTIYILSEINNGSQFLCASFYDDINEHGHERHDLFLCVSK